MDCVLQIRIYVHYIQHSVMYVVMYNGSST